MYQLGGKYYILGKSACEECTAQGVINLYKTFLEACDCKEFRECNSYKDIRKLSPWNINTIGEAYQQVFKACHTELIEHWTDSMASLRERLEEHYHDEIEKQVNKMLIARECYGVKQLREEEKKAN